MWNFNYAIPSFLVLVIFMSYYFALPRIPIRINQTFIKLVIVEFLVTTTNIVSTWACINYAILPVWLLYLLNEAYFVAFFMRAYIFSLFTANVLKSSFCYDFNKRCLLQLPFFAFSLLIISSSRTHLFFYIDETGYHNGPGYNLLYLLFILYLAFSFVLIRRHRTRVRRKREFTSISWYNLMLFIGLILRFAFPQYLLMGTFCLMALIIIYLSFENPDFYLEPRTWIFNNRALREYVEEINNRKKYTILQFVIHNYADFRELYGARQMDQGIALIGNYLRKEFKDEMVFYYRSGRFILLGEYNFDYELAYDMIKERFKSSWEADDAELYLDIGAAVLHFGELRLQYESVLNILSDGFDMAAQSSGEEIIIIDREAQDKNAQQGEIKKALKFAIEHDQVKVFLQPIMNSKTGRIEGAEALTRIVDNTGKIIPPSLFIPIAEKNGMINQLGDQAFEQTCRFIKEKDVAGRGISFINVNLSPIQFMRTDIAEKLEGYVRKYGIDPEFIHLEITEEALIDETLLLKQMQALISKGFCFALDDYGKGYSNLSRLRHCPFINIKLDMSLVWDYCRKPDEMVPSMVDTFKKMGFSITAEGIEDGNMAEDMSEVGVNYLQGFHFSKPIPMEDFESRYLQTSG